MNLLKLDVKLFGAPRILADGREVLLPYKKADAVLYYVTLRGSATRSRLAELLWPDAPAETGLKNLRHAIYSIRKSIGWNPFSEQQRSAITFSPEVAVRCDVLEFLASGDTALYSGDLLEGVSIPSADAYESWMQEERRQLQIRYLDRLLAAAQDRLAKGDWKGAEQYGVRYMQIEPAEENNVMLLMQVYRLQHQFRKAIALYQSLCKRLSDEYGIVPLAETTELYYSILNEWNGAVGEAADDSECLLLGKDAAVRRLMELCGGARRQPKSRCVMLEGAAGVGKTYLLDWMLKSGDLSDCVVCRGTCYQTEMEHFLAPWNTVMLSLVSELEYRGVPFPAQHLSKASALFPALQRDSDEAPNKGYPVQISYESARQSALMLLSAVSRRTPLLLVFEDVHWMDKGSVELLAMLLRRVQSDGVSVICTARDILPAHIQEFVDLAERDKIVERFRLQNFSREETARYLRFYAPQELSTEQEHQIYRSTGGNALLLSQMVSSLEETHQLPSFVHEMEDIIRYRLASLLEDERRVLELVSVCINAAPFNALTAILKKSAIEQTYLCCQLTQKKLLTETVENGELFYGFSHERIKSAVLERMTETARRMLCLRVAQYLQQTHAQDEGRFLERLIYYYEQGGDRLHALQYQILSLEYDAGVYYELMPTLDTHTLSAQANNDRLLEHYQSLASQLDALRRSSWDNVRPELDRMELMLLHAQSSYYIHEGFYDEGLPVLERLLALSESTGDRRMARNAHRKYIYYGIQTDNTALMRQHIERACALLDEGSSPELGAFLRLRGLLLLMEGDHPAARAELYRAIDVFRALEDCVDGKYAINIAGCYNYIAETYRLQGDYETAFSHYDQAINYNRNREYYPGAAVFYTNYGVAAWQAGQREEARRMFHYAADIYASSHEYSAYPIALAYLACYDVEDGNDRCAAERLRHAMALNNRIGSCRWTGVTICLLWRIRKLLQARRRRCEELEALWPESERAHCEWALSHLRKLQPCLERAEMEEALRAAADA